MENNTTSTGNPAPAPTETTVSGQPVAPAATAQGETPAAPPRPAEEIKEDEEASFLRDLSNMTPWHKGVMAVAIAAFIAILVTMWMWSQEEEFHMLYSNLTDQDGSAIVDYLQQQKIPYKFSEGGGVLLIPKEQVHLVRLRLAALSLPKGGPVGFELMENQKFGTSQFLEQVNYQRSLEGELARSMQTIGSVKSARVHLAIPKPTVFVKEQQKPSASVILTLYPGRVLDPAQVNAIVHLISSSIPSMPANNVTIVDQLGTLLSSIRDTSDTLDAKQLKYVRQLEQDYIKRIEDILIPLMGAPNVRVQVTADLDFSQSEQTSESFGPNQPPNQAAVRSQQTAEAKNDVNKPAGVPGALSNQPPVPATAPIVIPSNAIQSGESTSSRKEATTNFEVDHTIRHTKIPTGALRRLSAAVLINNRSTTDAKGRVISKPFTPAELAQLNNLVRNAMGFDAQRGDSLNLLNSAFNDMQEPPPPEIPLWKQPEMIALAKEFLKYIFLAIAGLYILFGILRPILRKYVEIFKPKEEEVPEEEPTEVEQATDDIKVMAREFAKKRKFRDNSLDNNVELAKNMARQTPKIVASVVQDWVNE